MSRSHRVLYSCFLRLFRRYQREAIPLTGVVGVFEFANGRPKDFLRAAFRNTGNFNLESGFQLLSKLQIQLDTLVSSEEETRKALAEWERLTAGLADGSTAAQPLALAAAVAAEQGMNLLVQQSLELDELFAGGLQHLHSDEEDSQDEEGPALRAPATVDSLAEEVLQRYAQLAAAAASAGPTHLPPAAAAVAVPQQELSLKVEALLEVLYARHKFCYRPFEWVYDGLKPVLLPEVLKRRRGAPLPLAVLCAAVGRSVGLPLTPIPAFVEGGARRGGGEAWGQGQQEAAPDALTELPPHLASRLSGAAQGALGPSQTPWLLRMEGCRGGPVGATGVAGTAGIGTGQEGRRGDQGMRFVDAGSGSVMQEGEATSKYPAMQLTAVDWAERSPLLIWQSLVKTVVQAHQRRGESDLVAHWMYVLMALDPFAQEWECMMEGG